MEHGEGLHAAGGEAAVAMSLSVCVCEQSVPRNIMEHNGN